MSLSRMMRVPRAAARLARPYREARRGLLSASSMRLAVQGDVIGIDLGASQSYFLELSEDVLLYIDVNDSDAYIYTTLYVSLSLAYDYN